MINFTRKLFSANGAMAAVLTVALLALGFSVLQLESIFDAEHQRNVEILSARKQGIENYATKLLQEQLQTEINAAVTTMPTFLDNPLLDASNYFWQQHSQQRIPFAKPHNLEPLQAERYYQQLQIISNTADPDSHWSKPYYLLSQLQRAIMAADNPMIETTVRDILNSTLNEEDNVATRLTYRIVMLEVFSRYKKASPALIEKLLREGLQDGTGATVPGLQKQLLLARMALNDKDFVFLKDKVLALSVANNVRTKDFVARLEDSATVPQLGENLIEGLSLHRDGWLFERDGDNIFGVRVDKQHLLQTIEANMLHLGLLQQGERLAMHLPTQILTPASAVTFAWQSAAWEQAVADVERFNALKTTTLLAAVVVLLAVIGLTWWMYRKQARWIATKSEFVATVSHELRTPLSGIRLMAERLATQLAGNQQAKDYPQRIISDVDTLSFLADNILSYERINSGQWISHQSPVGLQETVADLQRELPAFVKKSFVIQCHGDASTQLYADPVLIKLLFMNLAKNSCTYNSREQALINISWREQEGRVVVDYQDNGCGFDADEIGDCFSAFYRGRKQRHTRGSGLGLALCKKITALHHGDMAILLTNDEGTLFRLRFKVTDHG